MANFVFNAYAGRVGILDTLDIRAILEQQSSDYDPNPDTQYVADMVDFAEISVASYARVALSNMVVSVDNANDRVEFVSDPIDWGVLEASPPQIIKSVILYEHVGTDDVNGLVAYFDTITGLPFTLNGTSGFKITPDVQGLLQARQPA